MKNYHAVVGLGALALAIVAAPSQATDFTLMGSYWETDAAGDTAGGGVITGIPVNDMFAFELRATYFEELSDDPFDNIFDSDDPVFQDKGIRVLPLEVGVRFTFAPDAAMFRPHLAGGLSYFLLDSDFGNVSDELGYYAGLGATIGDGSGADFFIEATYRTATAQVEIDPEDLGDIDDIDIEDEADLDIDGIGLNLGIRWSF